MQLSSVGAVFFQRGYDIAIKFNRIHFTNKFQQRFSHRTQAWTDFDQALTLLWINTADDALDDILIDQKILAKTFFCMVLHFRSSE